MDNKFVENVAASLVREYLSRKGLKDTLSSMDAECPRESDSISNRQQLMKALRIEKIIRKNKELESPHKSMIEMMTRQYLEKAGARRTSSTSEDPRPPSAAAGPGPTPAPMSTLDEDVFENNYLKQKHKYSKVQNDLVIEDDIESETVLGEGKAGLLEHQDEDMNPASSLSRSKGKLRGMSGPISSNLDDKAKRRRPRSSRPVSAVKSEDSKFGVSQSDSYLNDPITNGTSSMTSARPTSGVTRYTSSGTAQTGLRKLDKPGNNNVPSVSLRKLDNEPANEKPKEDAAPKTKPTLTSRISGKLLRKQEDEEEEDYVHTSVPSRGLDAFSSSRNASNGSSTKPSAAMTKVGDIEIGDMDDLEDDLAELEVSAKCMPAATKPPNMITDSKPIDIQTAMELKLLIFGSASTFFNNEWRFQGFTFCDIPRLQYGIVQKKGGPCGVLAAVQACMLKHLLFMDETKPTSSSLNATRERRSEALAAALSEILWRSGDEKYAVVALPSGRSIFSGNGRYKPDGLTETLVLNYFKKYDELQSFMKQCVHQYEIDGQSGVILLLYSAILSRTMPGVKSDMDEPNGKLMGAHGYCTQDMVNLLLTGRAVSNVFNDTVTLDGPPGEKSTVLNGVTKRGDVGLLSLFEHYKSCQVGTYLKTPRYPIWVVCSESHFSVLFALKRELLSDWRAERRFDLYYYDGLGKQDEEIKLSIDTTNRYFTPPSDDDLVPPLEHCIRTKWADAEVDWNGTEPLL